MKQYSNAFENMLLNYIVNIPTLQLIAQAQACERERVSAKFVKDSIRRSQAFFQPHKLITLEDMDDFYKIESQHYQREMSAFIATSNHLLQRAAEAVEGEYSGRTI